MTSSAPSESDPRAERQAAYPERKVQACLALSAALRQAAGQHEEACRPGEEAAAFQVEWPVARHWASPAVARAVPGALLKRLPMAKEAVELRASTVEAAADHLRTWAEVAEAVRHRTWMLHARLSRSRAAPTALANPHAEEPPPAWT